VAERLFASKTQEKNMRIGSFTQDPQGNIVGQISGLGIGIIPVELQSQVSRDGDPFFKMIANQEGEPYEIGAVFPKEKEGRPYYSVLLDSPLFPKSLHAAMFYDDRSHLYNLVWERLPSVAPKAEYADKVTPEEALPKQTQKQTDTAKAIAEKAQPRQKAHARGSAPTV
jgi:uncharacterized protein (DUF736 family)